MKKSPIICGCCFLLGPLLVVSYSPWLAAQTDPSAAASQQLATTPPTVPLGDGSHDFDFLIGDWKAHARVLRDRLNGWNDRVEYEGISNHTKLLDSNANSEEFDAYCAQLHKRNKGQALRSRNPSMVSLSCRP